MKIKYQVPRGLRAKKKTTAFHWWLVPEKSKKASRLPQLNRRNASRLAANLAARRLEGSANTEGSS